MSNTKMFEQAIADAKAIREAAIVNAKLALEETLTEGVKELLADKLKALEEADDAQARELAKQAASIVAEAEEAEEEDAEDVDAAAGDEMADDAEGDSEEMGDEAEGQETAGDLTIDDIKDMIRDIFAQEMGKEEEGDEDIEVSLDEPMGDEEGMEGDEEDTEVDLEEILAELAKEEGNGMEEANEMDDQGNQNDLEEGMGDILANLKNMIKTLASNDKALIGDDFFAKLDKATDIKALEKLAAVVNRSMAGAGAKAGSNVGAGGTGSMGESQELNEALKTIEALQNELNEINLLNAKLLYLNKIFKDKSLSENQKANTIAAFDKAETVKEAKLVYETINESLSAGSKATVNEVKGMASKAAGVAPKKPEMIVEANEAVLRMQKLAGIIK